MDRRSAARVRGIRKVGQTTPMSEAMDALLVGRIGLLVRIQSHPGKRLALLDTLNDYCENLDQEPGTEAFMIALDPSDDDVIWLYEWFTDQAALDAHRSSDAFADLMHRMPELVAVPPGVLPINPLRVRLARQPLEQSL
jgi:quinol monooxygenase YgiN